MRNIFRLGAGALWVCALLSLTACKNGENLLVDKTDKLLPITPANATMVVGDKVKFSHPAAGATRSSWETSSSVADIAGNGDGDEVTVEALEEGTTTLSFSVHDSEGDQIAHGSTQITVRKRVVLIVDPTDNTVLPGGTVSLGVTAVSGGTVVPVATLGTLAWSSGTPSVADVDQSGNVSVGPNAMPGATATITAALTIGTLTVTASATVRVGQSKLDVTLAPNASTYVAGTTPSTVVSVNRLLDKQPVTVTATVTSPIVVSSSLPGGVIPSSASSLTLSFSGIPANAAQYAANITVAAPNTLSASATYTLTVPSATDPNVLTYVNNSSNQLLWAKYGLAGASTLNAFTSSGNTLTANLSQLSGPIRIATISQTPSEYDSYMFDWTRDPTLNATISKSLDEAGIFLPRDDVGYQMTNLPPGTTGTLAATARSVSIGSPNGSTSTTGAFFNVPTGQPVLTTAFTSDATGKTRARTQTNLLSPGALQQILDFIDALPPVQMPVTVPTTDAATVFLSGLGANTFFASSLFPTGMPITAFNGQSSISVPIVAPQALAPGALQQAVFQTNVTSVGNVQYLRGFVTMFSTPPASLTVSFGPAVTPAAVQVVEVPNALHRQFSITIPKVAMYSSAYEIEIVRGARPVLSEFIAGDVITGSSFTFTTPADALMSNVLPLNQSVSILIYRKGSYTAPAGLFSMLPVALGTYKYDLSSFFIP